MSSLVILEPPTTRALVSIKAVREQFKIDPIRMPDNRITDLIMAASAMVAVYCRRQFGFQTVRERFAVSARCAPLEEIVVGLTPIGAIVSVSANGDIVEAVEYEHNETTVFNLDDDGEHVPWYGRSFTLIYRGGYVLPGMDRTKLGIPATVPDLPGDVARAVMLLIGVSLSGTDRDIMIKAEETEGVGRTEYYVQGANAAMPHPEAEAILRGYRMANL